jgi:tRNA threonylcarbamoyladenosine biosynthesis protein TsaB
MNILAFDTSGEILSLILFFGKESREVSINQGMRHVQSLMPEIDRIISESRINQQEIDLIVTSRGPGSFTGLRIGIATAKGLSEALGIPFITIPSLDAIAYPRRMGNTIPVLPLIDARKGRFYGALYEGISGPIDVARADKKGIICDYFDLPPEELITRVIDTERASSGLLFTGPAAPLFVERAPELIPEKWLIDPFCKKGTAFSLAILGQVAYNERGGDKAGMGPLYLRKSEAELSRIK